MYALADSAEGDCNLSVPPDPGIAAAALGASASPGPGTGESAAPRAGESALSGTAPTEALHTFTLDSGASRSFFRDSTTLTPLSWPVAVSQADPSKGPVLAHSSMVLPCPAAPSGLLLGLHHPSFSTNLVSGADLQDVWVEQFAPGGQRVTHCTCSRTGRHLATFTRQPGSSLYTLTTAPPPVSASGQVAASSQVFAAASKSSMASRTLVLGLPRCLPPLPPGPASTCVPCVEGRQCAAPHSSSFPPTEAPLQTLHMDVWGPARIRGEGHERYFLLVVGDYSRYTTVFPLRSKGDITEVLIDWIRGARRQLIESFGSDLPVLCLHSDRGGEFSSDLLRAFCRAEGIRQTFTLPASPQQNGISERRIGMFMDVARTSMIHAAAPHFLWPFAVQYAAHQINLQPRVSLPETTPTLRWTGKVGDASAFRVWGSRAFVRDTSADKLSSGAVPCVFLGFPLDSPEWQFYHPTSRRVLSSQDVTFDESVSYYHLFPYCAASLPPPATLPRTRGAEPAGAGTGGADPASAVPERVESGGAEPMGAEPGGAEPERVEPGGAVFWGAESGGSPGVPLRREPLSLQQLREWYIRRSRRVAGAGAAGGAVGAGAAGGASGAGAAGGAAAAGAARGAAGAGAAGGAAGAGATRGVTGAGAAGGATGAGAVGGAAAAGAARGAAGAGAVGGAAGAGATRGVTGAGAAGGAACAGAARGAAGVGAAGASGPGGALVTGDPGAEGTEAVSAVSGGAAWPRPYYVLLLQHVLGLLPSPSPPPPLLSPQPPESRHVSPVSRAESLVRTARAGRVLRLRPHPVPGTHSMTLCPSTAPQRVPLPSSLASSLPDGPDSESDSLRAASPTVTRFLATAVTDPLFESSAASALVAELVDFAAACRLDYATSLIAESASPSVCPLSVGEAIEGPYSSKWQAAMDAEMDSWKSTGTYINEVPPPGANIVSGMWIFRVKRPPGSSPVFKVRYIARGFSQRQGVHIFHTFSPTPKMTTLRDPLHVAAQRDYELHSLDFSTAFLQGSLHEEIWLRRPPGFTGSFPAGTHDTTLPPFYVLVNVDDLVFATTDTEALAHVKSELQKRHTCTDLGELTSYLGLRITRDKAQRTITLTQSHMVQQVLQRFGFTYSSPQSTPLPTGHSLSAPPSDESVEPSGPYSELVGCLITSGMGLVLGGWARVVLTGFADASWVDELTTQWSSQGYTFSLGSGSVSWRSTHSSSVLSSSCEAEIYAGAMAAQELRWLTYLLTDLGEAPRSPPVMYVDNKAMLALCQEHRLEHRTKHIALRYFLA
ncbi:unnamed protein product [Closterium sp. NIES-53]